MTKKIANTVSYLFSIFNGRKMAIDKDSNYSTFMMNRYIAIAENYKFIDIAEFLNRKMADVDKEFHYEYLINKIKKGFCKIDIKNNFFSECKLYKDFNERLKPLVSDFNMKFEDIYFIMDIMSDEEYDEFEKLLDKLNETK